MRLIRGLPGTGKTALVLREFKAALADAGPPPKIVVPTATLVRHLQHELARDGAVFRPDAILSLNRFVAQRAPESKLAPAGLLRALTRAAVAKLGLPEFKAVADTPGLTAAILETIALFENAACTPEKLAATRKLSPEARAFEKIWRTVNLAVLERGFATRAELFRAAAANTEPLRIWFDGFLTLSPLEADLIRTLDSRCDLTFTLTDSRGTDDIRRLALQLKAEDRLLPGAARKPRTVVAAAVTVEREADEIARRIIDLKARGTAFRDIGVALRDIATYLPLLRGVFERFGIPARYYFATPLRHHPAAGFLNGLVECTLNGWEFEAALDTLRNHPQWGRSAAFDRFDFAVREAMPGLGTEALLGLAEEGLAARLSACFELEIFVNAKARPADWRNRLLQMAETLYRPGLVEPLPDRAGVETARSLVAGLRAWTVAIETATAFWRDPEHAGTLQDFWKVASETVEAATVQVADDRRDAVHVMSVFEARQWDTSALFVCGMTDRDFPQRTARNLLLPESELDSLAKSGIALRRSYDREREEDALCETLKTRARDTLVFTYPAHDAAGRSVESSRCLLEMTAEVAQSPRCRPVRASASAGQTVRGRIQEADLIESLGLQHRSISLTALEDMAQCHFRFFASRSLGLKGPPERPRKRLHPRVTGLIVHEALEAWLNNKREGDFTGLFETAFENACVKNHLPPGYQLEVERIRLREIARGVSAAERWQGMSSEAEVPLTLDFPGGITVNCRVDRIDRLNERDCIIVDYKSGKTANVGRMVESAVKLQGPLYALAARERLNLNTVAMMYVAVREDKRFGWGEVPGVDLGLRAIPENWIEDARDRSIERIATFLSGAVKAEPTETAGCRWCDFAGACRVEVQELVMIEGARSG